MEGNQGALAFREYGLNATKRFLKTAIVIDDEIIAAPLDGEEKLQVVPPAFASDTSTVADGPQEEEKPVVPDAEVAIKPLADAFLDKQIVCGVLKPVATDKDIAVIERAVRAASVADIVIIDWYLRKADDNLALSIIERILLADKYMNGRLRLILVYTSAEPLLERCTKLAQHVEGKGISSVPDPGGAPLLTIGTCKVKFIKKKSLGAGVSVEELPDIAIEEFAKHSSGLLANFALLGIGALRDATHHIISNFSRRMDHAFVGHRMLSGEQNSAHDFALSLFMLQVRSALSLPTRLGSALSDAELTAWFEDRFKYAQANDQLKAFGLDKAALGAQVLAGVDKRREKSHQALFLPEAIGEADKVDEIEKLTTLDFSRLSTFAREMEGFNPLPDKWLPTLTLGTIVKFHAAKPKYYMCLQPLCDTVRIDDGRYFPFIELLVPSQSNQASQNTENLVIKDTGSHLVLTVNLKAGSRRYVKFTPDKVTKTIRAEKQEAGFAFQGPNEDFYWWIGDVDTMKAQRIAVDVASTLARVGIDEYEWLRLGGQLKK